MNYILSNENAIYYECGYSNDNALYLQLGSDAFLLTDSRYQLEATRALEGVELIIERDLYAKVNELLKASGIKKLHYDPKEWSVFQYEKITQGLTIRFKPTPDLSHQKRMIKSERELKKLKIAARLGAKSFDRLAQIINDYGFKHSEYVLTHMAKSALSKYGYYPLSFDPIVAVGANAAKPHALPTMTHLHKKDLLLVDAGLKYERYCSDRTRTVCARHGFDFSTKQRFKKKKIQKAYDAVLKAHDTAIEKARSGMKAKEVDALTREIIEKAGFGRYFIHSTGHGVGLDIHEMPYIASTSETIIEDGMVYTIEPGIYIPDEFGIRIEDMVAMVNGQAVVL